MTEHVTVKQADPGKIPAADRPAVAVCAARYNFPLAMAEEYWAAAPEAERENYRALAEAAVKASGLPELVSRYGRITTAWTRGMYAAWIDCVRGDVKAAIECLAEGTDGYDGPQWDGTETGAQWWERTKAEEGL